VLKDTTGLLVVGRANSALSDPVHFLTEAVDHRIDSKVLQKRVSPLSRCGRGRCSCPSDRNSAAYICPLVRGAKIPK
jgi:hypothetical protein